MLGGGTGERWSKGTSCKMFLCVETQLGAISWCVRISQTNLELSNAFVPEEMFVFIELFSFSFFSITDFLVGHYLDSCEKCLLCTNLKPILLGWLTWVLLLFLVLLLSDWRWLYITPWAQGSSNTCPSQELSAHTLQRGAYSCRQGNGFAEC